MSLNYASTGAAWVSIGCDNGANGLGLPTTGAISAGTMGSNNVLCTVTPASGGYGNGPSAQASTLFAAAPAPVCTSPQKWSALLGPCEHPLPGDLCNEEIIRVCQVEADAALAPSGSWDGYEVRYYYLNAPTNLVANANGETHSMQFWYDFGAPPASQVSGWCTAAGGSTSQAIQRGAPLYFVSPRTQVNKSFCGR